MNKNNFSTAVSNLKKNFPLLLSTGAALCLFTSESIISLVLVMMIFLATCFVASHKLEQMQKIKKNITSAISLFIAVCISFVGYDNFNIAWNASSKVASLANKFGMTTSIFITVMGLLCMFCRFLFIM